MRWVSVAFLCLILFTAAQSADQRLTALDSAFASGDYVQTEIIALRLLQNEDGLSDEAKTRVHLTTGYALIMRNQEQDARAHFSAALDLNPDLTLDPVEVSPKFRAVFEDVKQDRGANKRPDVIGKTLESAALGLLRPSPTSHVLNLALPGAGHLNEQEYLRGAAWLGLQAVSVGVFVWRLSALRDSRDAYLEAAGADEIARRYEDYDRDYRIAWYSGTAAAAVYAASQIEFAFMKRKNLRLGWTPQSESPVLKLCLSW